MIKLKVKVKIFPTEELDKIRDLLILLYQFPEFELSEPDENGVVTMQAKGEGHETLNYLFSQVRNQRTVEAVRRHVISYIDYNNSSVSFYIHKQALMNKRVALCHNPFDIPLGPILIEISAENIEATINYLFPPTKDGKVLEVDYPLEE